MAKGNEEAAKECVVLGAKLNAANMIDILAGFNIKVTQQDLKGQNVDKIIEIHKSFLKTCLNVDEPAFEAFTFEITSNFTEEVLVNQKTAFKKIQLYSLIYAMFDLAGIKGFIPEVFFPCVHGKGMFKNQINTLINFARFEYIHLQSFSSIQGDYNTKLQEVSEIQKKVSWYKSQNSTLKQDKNERRIPIENAKKRINTLTEHTNQIVNHRTRTEEEIAKWEKELANIAAEKEDMSNKITTNQRRIQFVDKLLIKSPEKLRKDIDKNKIKITDTQKLLLIKKEENDNQSKIYAEREKFVDGLELVMESLDQFYLNDMQSTNKIIKEIEVGKEEKTNIQYEVDQLESKIKAQLTDKEKKQKEYETHREHVEKEMLALGTKDKIYQDFIDKIEVRTRNVEKSMAELKADQKASLEIFQTHMSREAAAIEWIQKQRENIEIKRRIFDEMHNLMRANFVKRCEKSLVGLTVDEEGLNELAKSMHL